MAPREYPPSVITTSQTPQEEHNISVCKEYMAIAYSPNENTGAKSTPMDYAESHSKVMASVADLRIIRFDQALAKDGHVLLRYTAEGSHCGKSYKDIPASGKHAQWSAAAIFEVEDGKIRSFTKEWDQKTMQIQLGWGPVKASDDPRWKAEALANAEAVPKMKE